MAANLFHSRIESGNDKNAEETIVRCTAESHRAPLPSCRRQSAVSSGDHVCRAGLDRCQPHGQLWPGCDRWRVLVARRQHCG